MSYKSGFAGLRAQFGTKSRCSADCCSATSISLPQRLVIGRRRCAAPLARPSPDSAWRTPLLAQDPPVPDARIGATLGIPVGSIGPCRGRCLDELRRDPAIAVLLDTDVAPAGDSLSRQPAQPQRARHDMRHILGGLARTCDPRAYRPREFRSCPCSRARQRSRSTAVRMRIAGQACSSPFQSPWRQGPRCRCMCWRIKAGVRRSLLSDEPR